MGMSDCRECWETPCSCGFAYRDWPLEQRERLAAAVLGIDITKIAKLLSQEDREKIARKVQESS